MPSISATKTKRRPVHAIGSLHRSSRGRSFLQERHESRQILELNHSGSRLSSFLHVVPSRLTSLLRVVLVGFLLDDLGTEVQVQLLLHLGAFVVGEIDGAG